MQRDVGKANVHGTCAEKVPIQGTLGFNAGKISLGPSRIREGVRVLLRCGVEGGTKANQANCSLAAGNIGGLWNALRQRRADLSRKTVTVAAGMGNNIIEYSGGDVSKLHPQCGAGNKISVILAQARALPMV